MSMKWMVAGAACLALLGACEHTTQSWMTVAPPSLDETPSHTSSPLLRLTGSCELGAIVVIDAPTGSSEGACTDDGRFELQLRLMENTSQTIAAHQRVERFRSERVTFTVEHDDLAPRMPSVTPVSPVVTEPRVTVTGETEPGASVEVERPDGETRTATASPDGRFEAEAPLPPTAEGPTVLRVRSVDAAGNRSPDALVETEYRPGAAPTEELALDPTPRATPAGSVTIRGATGPSAEVTVHGGDGGPVGGRADGDGRFEIEAALAPGDQRLVVATPRAEVEVAITRDALAPAAPSLEVLPAEVSATTVTVDGAGEPGAEVVIEVAGTTTRAPIGVSGLFRRAVGLPRGAHDVRVWVEDAAGNRSPERVQRVVGDADSRGLALEPTPLATATGTVTVRGETIADALVEVSGGVRPVSARADAAGRFAIDVALGAGRQTLTVRAGEHERRVVVDHVVAPPSAIDLVRVSRPSARRLVVHGCTQPFAAIYVTAEEWIPVAANAAGCFELDLAVEDASPALSIYAVGEAGLRSPPVSVDASTFTVGRSRAALHRVRAPRAGVLEVEGTALHADAARVSILSGTATLEVPVDALGGFRAEIPRDAIGAAIDARVLDTAGAVIDRASHALGLARRVARAPVTALLSHGAATRDCGRRAPIRIEGAAGALEPLARVELDGGHERVFARADLAGRLTVDISACVGDELRIRSSAGLGAWSAAVTLRVSGRPGRPVLDSVGPIVTRLPRYVAVGVLDVFEPGTTVRVEGGATSATGPVSAGGAFAVEVSLRANETQVLAVTASLGGVDGATVTLTVRHDDVAPAPPTLVGLSILDLPVGVCLTRLPVRILGAAGSVEADALVRARGIDSGATLDARARADGSFELRLDACPGDRLDLIAVDAAGNASVTSRLEL